MQPTVNVVNGNSLIKCFFAFIEFLKERFLYSKKLNDNLGVVNKQEFVYFNSCVISCFFLE